MGIIADQLRANLEALKEADRRQQALTDELLIRANLLLHETAYLADPLEEELEAR